MSDRDARFKANEAKIRSTLSAQAHVVQEESTRLAMIESELAAIDELTSTDVELIRARIQELNVAMLKTEKRAAVLEESFSTKQAAVEAKEAEKAAVVQRMVSVLETHEQAREDKVESLIGQLEKITMQQKRRQEESELSSSTSAALGGAAAPSVRKT